MMATPGSLGQCPSDGTLLSRRVTDANGRWLLCPNGHLIPDQEGDLLAAGGPPSFAAVVERIAVALEKIAENTDAIARHAERAADYGDATASTLDQAFNAGWG
jgi:hypothetical protein